MSTFDTRDSVRAIVVATAATQAAQGAHYINGSDGGITGMNAVGEAGGGLSASRKIFLLEDYTWDKLAVHSAIYGGRVCKGRYAAVGGKKFMPVTTELTTLKDVYVPSLSSAAPATVKPFPGTMLYPRRGRSKPGDTIYLAEDCRHKRHFDCISFVNWVLTTVVGRLIWYEEKDYFSGSKMNAQILPATHTTFKNGDIGVRIDASGHEHIGFLNSLGQMIHARDPERGVQISPFEMAKDSFTKICRLPDSFF
ncbi:MAG TPA: hypothetical protein VJ781_10260 [Pyrinomonadaceae bacterium]|nr:hypothetical protein [Pyrinomonadaceae bacterium]